MVARMRFGARTNPRGKYENREEETVDRYAFSSASQPLLALSALLNYDRRIRARGDFLLNVNTVSCARAQTLLTLPWRVSGPARQSTQYSLPPTFQSSETRINQKNGSIYEFFNRSSR